MKHREAARGGRSDSVASSAAAESPPAQPHKRPRQGRSRFTVAAIYDALVRIWTRDGPAAVTMRNVALESGFAIGTLYEYFPNVDALMSGYARHLSDGALARLDVELRRTEGSWQERLRRFVAVCCDSQAGGYCDQRMLQMESSLARHGDYDRFFAKLEQRWIALFEGWEGPRPAPEQAAVLALTVWGARRFRELLAETAALDGWVEQLCRHCEAALRDSDPAVQA